MILSLFVAHQVDPGRLRIKFVVTDQTTSVFPHHAYPASIAGTIFEDVRREIKVGFGIGRTQLVQNQPCPFVVQTSENIVRPDDGIKSGLTAQTFGDRDDLYLRIDFPRNPPPEINFEHARNRIIVPKSDVAIAVCLVDLFGVDQDQPPYTKKSQLLDYMGPKATDANDSNAGGTQSILPFLAKEANVAIISLVIRDKGRKPSRLQQSVTYHDAV